ncbi:tetraacyldisaccharide 4'-kinase [Candidatus Pelagibacter sp.]|nr:tetraacyldisaccharide 4'-kinase [Candidatus Pelagibacter sp.]
MKLTKPYFWDIKKPNLISILLFPLTILLFLKNLFTSKNNQKIEKIKTICVGNIYIGGTGKTPFCIELNNILKNLNFKTAIIKKFYKDQLDEQRLINNKNKLYCEKNRIESIKKAIKDKNDIVILDDGLQEKKLSYDISFVCFNITKWIGNGFLLPAGPLREGLKSLKNYSAIILTGNGENTKKIRSQIKKYNNKIKIFETIYTPINIKKFNKNKNYLIFSGIGNPEIFKKTLTSNKIKVIKSLVFPDHYQYTDYDIKKIKQLAKNLKAKILTTEKDFMRINKNKKEIDFLKINLFIKNKKNLINFLKKNL